MNRKRMLSALLALLLLLPALSAAATAVEVETYVNVAVGSPYTASTPYTDRKNPNPYQLIDGKELTDGVKGSSIYGTEWHGFYNGATEDGYYYITVTLKETAKDIERLSIQCCSEPSSSINLPASVEYFIGADEDSLVSVGEAVKTGSGTYVDYVLDLDAPSEVTVARAKIKPSSGMFVFVSEFEIMTTETVELTPTERDGLHFLYNSTATVDGEYLRGVKHGTTTAGLAAYINLNDSIVVRHADGTVCDADDRLVTGDRLEAYFYDTLLESLTIVIEGDYDGDGRVSATDYLMAKRAVLEKAELTDVQKLSLCLSNGEKLTASDYLRIKRDVLKLGAIVDQYRDPIGEYDMEFKRNSDALYTLSCTYEGKPLTLTFDKKSWGTWNIGTWRYNGEALAGGGTDWEYVNMVGDVGGSLDWSGGNHGKETLVDIRFYDGATGEELLLSNGQSAEIRNLTIVERTELYTSDAKNPYANVTRTYRVAGNTITFEADCEFIRDVYMGRSYTCMFPVSKQYGQFAEFYKLDGSVEKAQTTLEGVKPDYSGPYIGRTDAMRVVMYGPKNPSYKFDVRVYSLADASDFFSNGDKTFVWDMNSTHNKLYFSKFDTGAPTLMQAGQRTSNKSTWTFTVEE